MSGGAGAEEFLRIGKLLVFPERNDALPLLEIDHLQSRNADKGIGPQGGDLPPDRGEAIEVGSVKDEGKWSHIGLLVFSAGDVSYPCAFQQGFRSVTWHVADQQGGVSRFKERREDFLRR